MSHLVRLQWKIITLVANGEKQKARNNELLNKTNLLCMVKLGVHCKLFSAVLLIVNPVCPSFGSVFQSYELFDYLAKRPERHHREDEIRRKRTLTGYFQRCITADSFPQVVSGHADIGSLIRFAPSSVNNTKEEKRAAG